MEMPWKILKSACWCVIRDSIWLSHGNLQLIDELFPLLRDERYVAGREEDVFAVRAVRLDGKGKIGVGQDLQAVLCVVFCGGGGMIVPGRPRARRL
jgi:hypothetical protein